MFYYDTSFIILIPAMIFAMIAQGSVSRTFRKYSNIRNRKNLTGAEAARMVLDNNGLNNVEVEHVRGNLTDHYDPRKRVLRLSDSVYGSNSVSAVSVACHEVGHAIQHAKGYVPLKIRDGIVPIVNLASNLTWPLVLIGFFLLTAGNYVQGNLIFNIGVITFIAVIAFHIITLPVEFNASRRAINQMQEYGIVGDEEVVGSKKVLRAAAMTYVAALAVAVANLIRILALRSRD
ncbi:MAG: zinc metallopeptidase [Eubacteriales bacterium]|nr:zinc metallopeptidase [Eubacteriales bacterium]